MAGCAARQCQLALLLRALSRFMTMWLLPPPARCAPVAMRRASMRGPARPSHWLDRQLLRRPDSPRAVRR
eukprot:9894521-Alexandrium_andersonii.AAC.1